MKMPAAKTPEQEDARCMLNFLFFAETLERTEADRIAHSPSTAVRRIGLVTLCSKFVS